MCTWVPHFGPQYLEHSMGPTSVFKLLKGELVDIVDYAVNCHKKTGRSPRLAVNASSWWYSSMTAATVQEIRDRAGKHVNVNPIERNILFYTLRILHLGIQLHFVFDNPKLVGERKKLYPGHDAPSLLFQETLTNIGIPWHEAPAEAEAECAKMEMEGIVDAVWSDDGDALAFGCKTLIMSHFRAASSTERAEDIRKSYKHFRVYSLEEIERQHPSMGREGFILHAILNGAPREFREINNLLPEDILQAAGRGLGVSLCAASGSAEGLSQWASKDFALYLRDNRLMDEIPLGFPEWKHVQNYLKPVVSPSEVFLGLPAPKDPFLNEKKLFSFLVRNFQWTIKQWVTYVLPVRIVRSLLATKEGEESQHDYLKLECDVKKNPKIVKTTFSLCQATSVDVTPLYETKGQFETLLWIVRKANFNEQRSIASYFITPPKSDRKGKGVSSASVSGTPLQKSKRGAGRAPLTPPSAAVAGSSGGPSRVVNTPRRQSTPPSPTPMPKKRTLPWARGTGITKNIRSESKTDRQAASKAKDKGKGKMTEISAPSRTNKRRAQSPEDSGSFYEELRNKRPKTATAQPPSTPPAQVTAPADTIPDTIVIDSDEDEDQQVISNLVVIDSDSDEDEYGSFPSVSDLTILSDITSAKPVQDDGLIDSSSSDEYGSLPPSPELRALV
ncbi:hypothetical protein F5884DRAFT_789187 [Xylogone sp. PMI_703]|nr:hypothetical protein F5884DRAFT_789187 [Xylogone sp. PMI_703]